LLYIEKRIKDGEKEFSYILENGATYSLILRNPSGSSHSLNVDFTYTIEPKDKEKPLQVYNLRAMLFSGLQLFADRVMITGECDNESDFVKRRFNEVWADMLQAFGAERPNQSENIIADNLGGTITYKRNEQGQTIPTGGAINPGYHVELGQGISLKPDQVPLNHTTGSFQPGLHPLKAKDAIIEVLSETLAGLAKNNAQAAQSIAANPEQPTVENTRIPAGKYDNLCVLWVNRPYIPRQTKEEFLYEHAGELDKKTFDRILKDAHARGIIDKDPGKNGRYKPKTVS
jgi:hypothetical protein